MYGLPLRFRSKYSAGIWPESGQTGDTRGFVALIELLPDFQHKPLDVSLVVAHRRNLSRRVRAFMKWIENVLAPNLE